MGAAVACATYSDRLLLARDAASSGAYDDAVSALNDVLGVDSADELPAKMKADRPLALLERGVLLQAQGRYRESARDLSAAEAELELLDLSLDALGSIGEYVYSGSSSAYRTPPSERLALNSINMLNYLALGDLDGAAVEARRFTVMREFLESQEVEARNALGSYLAGFVFEKRGEGDRALRYYEEALSAGAKTDLREPVRRLAAANPYRGAEIDALLTDAGARSSSGRVPSELLVVISQGRVPHKVPERLPLGVAVGLAGSFISGDLRWLGYSVAKVVIYPELVAEDGAMGEPDVRIDGRPSTPELLSDLAVEVTREYEELKPRIIGSAITRMLTRAAAAEGARQLGQMESGWVGLIAALATEGALAALDKPDTRSWTFLPARTLAVRERLQPGSHEVEVAFRDEVWRSQVQILEGGFSTLVVTEPR